MVPVPGLRSRAISGFLNRRISRKTLTTAEVQNGKGICAIEQILLTILIIGYLHDGRRADLRPTRGNLGRPTTPVRHRGSAASHFIIAYACNPYRFTRPRNAPTLLASK